MRHRSQFRVGPGALVGALILVLLATGGAQAQSAGETASGDQTVVLNYFGFQTPAGVTQPGFQLQLGATGSAVRAAAVRDLHYSIFFAAYSTALDSVGRRVVERVAKRARDLGASGIEVVADPDATAQAQRVDAFVAATSVVLELRKQPLPDTTDLWINRTPGAGILFARAEGGLLEQAHRVEVELHLRPRASR